MRAWFIVAAFFALFTSGLYAEEHSVEQIIPDPETAIDKVVPDGEAERLDKTPKLSLLLSHCQTQGVRAAVGAASRFDGSPAVFKYIRNELVYLIFSRMVDGVRMTLDAIYVDEDLDLGQRRLYEEAAFVGWKQADLWVQDGKERPDFIVLSAIFNQGCKDQIIKEKPDESK